MFTFGRLGAPIASVGAAPYPNDLFSSGYEGAWHWAWDRNYMTAAADGTGGVPAVGAPVARITDRSGGGRHLVQSTAANRPVAGSGFLAISQRSASGSRRWLETASAVPGDKQGATGLLICDTPAFPADWLPFTFTSAALAAAPWPCRNVSIAWRLKPTGFEVWVNGTQYTGAALTAGALSSVLIGATVANQDSLGRLYESATFDAALTDQEFASLRAYGIARAHSGSLGSTALVCFGDSRTYGVCSTNAGPWPQLTTAFASGKRFNSGRSGEGILSPYISAADLITKFDQAGMTCCAVWIGVNDFFGAEVAADVYAALVDYCTALRDAGWRVVVATETDTSNPTQTEAYSALIRANAVGTFAHAVADLGADTRLDDRTNTTYFADGLHLTDAGNVAVNELMTAAIASAIVGPNPMFSASTTAGEIPLSVNFTDLSTESPTSYLWDFGDGSTSTSASPSHTYTVAGTYDVSLTVTNAGGSHTITKAGLIVASEAVTMPTANLIGWYQQGTASGATWPDASPAGHDLTLYGSPTIDPSGSVIFDGVNDSARVTYTQAKPVTVYLRLKIRTWRNGYWLADGGTGFRNIFYMTGTSPAVALYPGTGPLASNSNMVVGSYCSVAYGPKPGGTQMFIQVSGSAETVSTGTQGNPDGFVLGGDSGGGSNSHIEVLEALVYAAEHDATDRAAALAYLDAL